MHLRDMHEGRVDRENRRFNRRTTCVGKAPVKGYADDIIVVDFDLIDSRSVTEPIEGFAQLGFELTEGGCNITHYLFRKQASRPPYKQPLICMKLHSKRKDHRSRFWCQSEYGTFSMEYQKKSQWTRQIRSLARRGKGTCCWGEPAAPSNPISTS